MFTKRTVVLSKVENRLEELRAGGWLQRFSFEVALPFIGEKPAAGWVPGDEKPHLKELRAIAAEHSSRMNCREAQLYVAAPLTLNLFGANCLPLLSREELARLAGWSELCMRISQRIGASDLQVRGAGTPGATDDLPTHVWGKEIRAAGMLCLLLQSCSRRGLEKVHKYCVRHGFTYEIW